MKVAVVNVAEAARRYYEEERRTKWRVHRVHPLAAYFWNSTWQGQISDGKWGNSSEDWEWERVGIPSYEKNEPMLYKRRNLFGLILELPEIAAEEFAQYVALRYVKEKYGREKLADLIVVDTLYVPELDEISNKYVIRHAAGKVFDKTVEELKLKFFAGKNKQRYAIKDVKPFLVELAKTGNVLNVNSKQFFGDVIPDDVFSIFGIESLKEFAEEVNEYVKSNPEMLVKDFFRHYRLAVESIKYNRYFDELKEKAQKAYETLCKEF